jgi:cytochrome c-type biogenesis protein
MLAILARLAAGRQRPASPSFESVRLGVSYSQPVESGFGLSPVLFVTALAAGLVSFASPCVLPLVPAYLGFITGRSVEQLQSARGRARLATFTQGLAFVLGLALIFALLGASASVLGRTLLQNRPLLFQIGGIVVVIFGLQMLGVLRIPWLYRTARVIDLKPNTGGSHVGALVMGIAFGAGWTPCVGPFLGSLLTVASSQDTVTAGVALLLVYALGLGIPFLLAALIVDRSLLVMRTLRPHMLSIERVSGALLVAMGILLFTDQLTRITSMLTNTFGNGLAL